MNNIPVLWSWNVLPHKVLLQIRMEKLIHGNLAFSNSCVWDPQFNGEGSTDVLLWRLGPPTSPTGNRVPRAPAGCCPISSAKKATTLLHRWELGLDRSTFFFARIWFQCQNVNFYLNKYQSSLCGIDWDHFFKATPGFIITLPFLVKTIQLNQMRTKCNFKS